MSGSVWINKANRKNVQWWRAMVLVRAYVQKQNKKQKKITTTTIHPHKPLAFKVLVVRAKGLEPQAVNALDFDIPFGHFRESGRGADNASHGAHSVGNDDGLVLELARINASELDAKVGGEADDDGALDVFPSEDGIHTCVMGSAVVGESRVAIDLAIETFLHNVIVLVDRHGRAEFSIGGIDYTVVRPQGLIDSDAAVRDGEDLERTRARMLRGERDVIVGVPVLSGDDKIELANIDYAIDNGEDLFGLIYGERALGKKAVLDVDDYKGGAFSARRMHGTTAVGIGC